MKILVLTFLKRSNVEAFFRPSTLKTENVSFFSNKGRLYIEESFDTISPLGYGSGKSPMAERVNTYACKDNF